MGSPASENSAAAITIARPGALRASPVKCESVSPPDAVDTVLTTRKAAMFVTPYATRCSMIAFVARCERSNDNSPLEPAAASAAMPMRRYPACPMLEYASSRLMLVCAMASRLPTTIVTAARATMMSRHSDAAGMNPSANSRMNSAKAAALEPTARYAVTGVGAPS